MAARRIFSLLSTKIQTKPLLQVTRDFHPSQSPSIREQYTPPFSSVYEQYTRRLETLADTGTESPKPAHESCELKPDSSQIKPVPNPTSEETTVTHKVNADLKVSDRHDLAMIYTCGVCDTRSIKTVCRESYDKGVVVVRCDGCKNLHLIADRLGWFGEPSSVEEFLAARGEEVKKGSVDTMSLTLEDLAGKKIM